MKSDRKFIFEYAKENYGTEPEYSNRQIFHVPHKEKTLADFGEGFSIFSFKFQYFINITNHILVLYLSLFQTYGFQKSNKCIGLFILI